MQKENADALKDEYEKALDVESKAKESANKYQSILKQKQDAFNEKVDQYNVAKQVSDDYKNTSMFVVMVMLSAFLGSFVVRLQYL